VSIVAIALIALGLLIALTMQALMSTIYHRSRLDTALNEQYRLRRADPRTGFVFIQAVDDLEASASYHRERLLDLDAIAELDYSFTNISSDSSLRTALIERLAAGDCPANLSWFSVETGDPSPMTVHVWCDHSDVGSWEAFRRAEDQYAAKKP